MRKLTLILLIVLIQVSFLKAQTRQVLVYDLVNKTLDSFPLPVYNSSIKGAISKGNIGTFNNQIANLERTLPTTFKYPGADYSLKIRVSKNYITTDYPIRTSAKLFKVTKDTTVGQCSGNMLSPWHYFTAAHCFKPPHNSLDTFWSDTLYADSFFISPIFDNGKENPNFGKVAITKIFFLKKFNTTGEDLAICELETPIGYKTGWLGYGFSKEDSSITNHINYKFSYPGFQYALDTFEFNGDSLYYYYGKVNLLDSNLISVKTGRAIPGESGSSIIVSPSKDEYIAYGALSYSFQQSNSRMNNYEYFLFKSIIEDKLTHIKENKPRESYSIYPNPSKKIFKIIGDIKGVKIVLINSVGQKTVISADQNQINLDAYPAGIYTVLFLSNKGFTSHRIVKI